MNNKVLAKNEWSVQKDSVGRQDEGSNFERKKNEMRV